MKTQIYHIRKKLTPARGNQFYKDRSNRGNGTFCGAAETDMDSKHNDKANEWTREWTNSIHTEPALMVPCPHCVAARGY